VRVAVLTTSFPRSEDDPSGHFVRSSARALAAQGHEVHVIAPGGSPFAPPRPEDGLTLHRVGGGSLFAWPGALARAREAPWRLFAAGVFAAGALGRVAALGPVDRVVAHWIVPCAFPLAAAILRPDMRLDVVAHGADVRLLLAAPRAAREGVIRSLCARGASFTFASAALMDALGRAMAPDLAADLSRRAHVEPPPIDVPRDPVRAAALRASLDLGSGERVAVAASRLIPSKRVDLAIAAASAVPLLRLVVVGDGPERAALSRRAEELGAKVTFTGALPRREALAWIAAADVLLHPSALEAAPSVVREARALGVPVVACDAGDVAAWAKDDPGIRVAEATVEALAGALRA
jgi:teichuronic acid biosynthesis glycosyltransferase TuaC